MIDLTQRIKTALSNYCDNKDAMHVPLKDTDVDVVLSDCLEEIESLKQKLARYENPDYVLVPKVPSDKMLTAIYDALEVYYDDWSFDADRAYKGLIEAVENNNESNN